MGYRCPDSSNTRLGRCARGFAIASESDQNVKSSLICPGSGRSFAQIDTGMCQVKMRILNWQLALECRLRKEDRRRGVVWKVAMIRVTEVQTTFWCRAGW